MSIRSAGAILLSATLALGCAGEGDEDLTITLGEADDTTAAVAYWPGDEELTAEDIERGRLDLSWRAAVEDTTALPDTAPPSAPRERPATPLDADELAPEPVDERPSLPGPAAPVRVRSDTLDLPETYEEIDRIATRDTVELPAVTLPLSGDVQGPSVLYVQILLDRSPFSPGIIDGKWGKNTDKAVYWLQKREGIDPTGTVDSTTFQRLYELAGRPDRYVRTVTLTEDDVSGPFVTVPADIYQQAELDCLCYDSASEKVAERYHASPDLLARLNPDADLANLKAGDRLRVPNVEKSPLSQEKSVLAAGRTERTGADRPDRRGSADTTVASRRDSPAAPERPARSDLAGGGEIAKIVISGAGFYLHAVDADGRVVYHYPTTLGSEYAPSPQGSYSIASIAFAPWFHWKPALLTGEDPSKPDARLPPGPNSPVGLVWMQLSKPHYGIHGTSAPATIGYVTSHGCVRLTNWDAVDLAHRVAPGVPVEFRDVRSRGDVASMRR